jgi:hypothetical protein
MPIEEKFESYAGHILANYVKRWMEGNAYDRLFSTKIGNQLKDLNSSTKYFVEAVLNVLSAFFEGKLEGDGLLRKMVKEVGSDAAPEISKRILNHASKPEEQIAAQILSTLDPLQLKVILDWLYISPTDERTFLFRWLSGLSKEEIEKFASLSVEDRSRLASLARAGNNREGTNRAGASWHDSAVRVIRNLRLGVTKLREKRLEGQRGTRRTKPGGK